MIIKKFSHRYSQKCCRKPLLYYTKPIYFLWRTSQSPVFRYCFFSHTTRWIWNCCFYASFHPLYRRFRVKNVYIKATDKTPFLEAWSTSCSDGCIAGTREKPEEYNMEEFVSPRLVTLLLGSSLRLQTRDGVYDSQISSLNTAVPANQQHTVDSSSAKYCYDT